MAPKKILFPLLCILLVSATPIIEASSDTTTINFEGSSSISYQTWEPWLTNWRFTFDIIYETNGVTTIEWYNQKDALSPNEETDLEIVLINTDYNPELKIIVEGYKKTSGEKFLDHSVSIPIPSAKLPGHFETPKIGAPVIPLEIFGIPAEIFLQAKFKLDTEYEIRIRSKEMIPDIQDYIFSSNNEIIHNYQKNNKVGAEFSLIRTGILSEGYLTLSVSLAVANIPTPLSIDFREIPFTTGYEYYSHNDQLCCIKTPIDIALNDVSSVVNQNQEITIQGSTNPKIKDGTLSFLVGGTTISSIRTDNNGNFITQWSSTTPGIYSISVKAIDSEYVSESYSESKTIRINERPTASFSVSKPRVKVDEKVSFTDQSFDNDGSISQWQWSFGDGQTSSSQNPSHVYSKSGTYTITLTVRDNDGSEDEYRYTGLLIEKTDIDIQIDSDKTNIQIGDSVEIFGDTYPSISDENLVIHIEDPNGNKDTELIVIHSGEFSKEFEFDKVGTWEIKASFNGNEKYSSAESNTIRVTVEENPVESSSEPSESSSSEDVKEGGIPSFSLTSIALGFLLSGFIYYWNKKKLLI